MKKKQIRTEDQENAMFKPKDQTTNTDQYWPEFAASHLAGRTITTVRYMSQEEADLCGFNSRAVVLQLDDGSVWFPSMDDEGNDAGALFGQKNQEAITLPVL